MVISSIKATFGCDINTVWEVVTSLDDCSWRTDLERIEVVNERQFIEHSKDGYATTFTTTKLVPYKRWEFDMESEVMRGCWVGEFVERGPIVEISFTEKVGQRKPS